MEDRHAPLAWRPYATQQLVRARGSPELLLPGAGGPRASARSERPVNLFARLGLRVRLALLVGIGVITVGLGNFALMATLTRGWLDRELEARSRILATAVATRIATGALASDPRALATELEHAASEPDVLGAALYGPEGVRIAAHGSRPALWRALPWSAPPAAGDGSAVRPLQVGNEHGIEIIVPVARDERSYVTERDYRDLTRLHSAPGAKDEGWVRLLVSRARIDAALQTALQAGLAVLLGSLVLVLALVGWLSRRMLRPLREASSLAREIAAGQLDRRLPVHGHDELGTLALSMNSMASGLAQARAQARAEASALRVAAEAVIAIAREARATSDPQTVFHSVANELRRVTGSSGVAMLAPEAGTQALVLRQVDDATVWQRVPRSAAFERDLGGALAAPEAAPVRVSFGTRADALSRMLVRAGMITGLLVPIPLDDAPSAVVLLVSERPDAFPASEVDVVAGLSSHLSSALHASLLRKRLQRSLDDLEETRAQLLRSERLRVAGEMASGIAHDFNNVLGAIQGRAQLLRRQAAQETLSPTQLTRALEIIEQAARDGAETVRRLRQFGRPGETAPLESVSLAQALREAAEYTRTRWENEAQAAGRRIELIQEIDPESWVTGRGTEIREVFTNLILNAIDALPAGGSIRIGCVGSGPLVRAWVEDDGIGMPPEVRSRIFDPFFTTKGERGTGLGLSVVYGIVQRHGGTLDVRSEAGAGTRFEITFPRSEATLPACPEAVATASAPTRVLDVLVVDDEPAVRGLLSEILTLLGHQVVEHVSAEAALEFFERGRFDLVLTDLGLPGMSGWTFARRLRDVDPDITITFVTGWGEDISHAKIEEVQADGFIGKPFGIEDVEGLTRLAVARAERRGEQAA